MRIRHVSIERFRGIKKLDWTLGLASPICLVGAGDSTKSTIIDAIEFALSPRWNIQFSDSDFYDADTSQSFIITVAVGDLPDDLLKESKFGLHLRGWNRTKQCIHDEPQEGDETILSVRLEVKSSLEPEWIVVTDRTPEGIRISSEDRERIGAVRIDSYTDRHLSWSRGSVLARLTGKVEEMPAILAEAGREARKALKPEMLTKLNAAAKEAETIVKAFGVLPTTGYLPHLDIRELEIRAGGLSLHDGNVPVRQAGLGTRRLITLSLQHDRKKVGSCITLIDEVEHGLEPHRLRRLLRVLRPPSAANAGTAPGAQVIFTTHSPIAVRELAGLGVYIVASKDGITTVSPVPDDDKLHKAMRSYPEAILGRTILVCEGETEVGLVHALDDWWSARRSLDPFACRGIVAIDGEGSSATKTACRFARMGFRVAVFLDSDRPVPEAELKTAGVHIVSWEGGCTEERIAKDLPWAALVKCIRLAMENRDPGSVLATVRSGSKIAALPDAPEEWPETPALRTVIGKTAKNNKWFKRIDWGEELGLVVAEHLQAISTTDLATKIEALRTWLSSE